VKHYTIFETQSILNEVIEQSEELDNYLTGRTREKVEVLVKMGGLLAIAVPAVLSLERVFGESAWVSTLSYVLLVLLLIGAGAFAWFMLVRQPEEM
jgi:hypothetical protein